MKKEKDRKNYVWWFITVIVIILISLFIAIKPFENKESAKNNQNQDQRLNSWQGEKPIKGNDLAVKIPKLIRIDGITYQEVNEEIKHKPTCGTADRWVNKTVKNATKLTEDNTANFEFETKEKLGMWVQYHVEDPKNDGPNDVIIARYNNKYHLFRKVKSTKK